MNLDSSQQRAVENILTTKSRVSVLTGKPGCGKTHTIKEILRRFFGGMLSSPERTYLCASSGKAAKVMESALDEIPEIVNQPQTVHRMLGFRGKEWVHGQDNKLVAELIICDEASMLDSELMARIIYSTPDGCKLLFVADHNQLPPVGAGAPIRDIVQASIKGQVSVLEINHRQQNGSVIASACENCLVGKPLSYGQGIDSLYLQEVEEKTEIPLSVLDLVREWEQNGKEYVVLSPQYNGEAGILNINLVLQKALNQAGTGKQEIKVYDYMLREGDKVMNTKNLYDLGVFNGFTGTIIDIGRVVDGVTVSVDFDGDIVTYQGLAQIKHLQLGRCISIHKSQGSEYKRGVCIIHSSHYYQLQRALLYVALSRFKEICHIVGDKKGINRALKNVVSTKRNTYLGDTLKNRETE